MIRKINTLKSRPVLTSFYGWLLFPGMYLLVGIFTALGISVEMSFLVASPAGVLGFICWVAALTISVQRLLQGQSIGISISGLIFSLIPLSFLTYGFWVAVNGGV